MAREGSADAVKVGSVPKWVTVVQPHENFARNSSWTGDEAPETETRGDRYVRRSIFVLAMEHG